ncbi:MAG: hypothetical protein P8Z37_09810 [Acidobacteriota bacterium]
MTNSPGLTLFLLMVHAVDRPKRNRKTSDIIIGKYLLKEGIQISMAKRDVTVLNPRGIASPIEMIPAAPVVTAGFPDLIISFAYNKGIPELRLTFVPHPFTARPVEL